MSDLGFGLRDLSEIASQGDTSAATGSIESQERRIEALPEPLAMVELRASFQR